MLNRTTALVSAFFIGLLSLMSACEVNDPISIMPDGKGSLQLNFSPVQFFLAKTIESDIDMQITDYSISGICAETDNTCEATLSSGSNFETTLDPGTWTLTVQGLNSAGQLVGEGSTTVSIVSGETTTASVSITPLPGNGYLGLNVSWPAGVLENPAVAGTVTPTGGTAQNISFSMAGDGLSASYGDSLSAGYYQVSIQLTDNGTVMWGRNVAARIVRGGSSVENYALVEDVNKGGLTLTINETMEQPVNITMSGAVESLTQGESMTVSASTDQAVSSYQWYLQGQELTGETGSSITIGSSLSPGNYYLDLVVKTSSVYSSEGIKFVVVAP